MGFENVPDFSGKNQERSVLPVFTTVRLCFDLSPVVSTNVFAGTKAPQIGTQDVQGFSYGYGDANASAAGFGTKTKPTVKHTNLQNAYKLPNGGRMAIESIFFAPMGHLLFPVAALPNADPNAVVDDTPGQQTFVDDFKTGQLYSFLLRLVDSCYVPYIQNGASGAKKYLPYASFLSPGRSAFDGRATAYQGPPFVFPEEDGGVQWSDDGQNANLIVGLELKRNVANQAWASTGATSQLFADIAAQLGVANTAAPAVGSWMVNLDIVIGALGYRKQPFNL